MPSKDFTKYTSGFYWKDVRSGAFLALGSIKEVDVGISAQDHVVERKDNMKKHEGKILIQVDEKDQNKVIAKNILTGETAEALCSPNDEFDFEAGASLALKRLTKKTYWTGKVICISTEGPFFEVGKGYFVENGIITDSLKTTWHSEFGKVSSLDDLNDKMKKLHKKFPATKAWAQFIEYKGGAD